MGLGGYEVSRGKIDAPMPGYFGACGLGLVRRWSVKKVTHSVVYSLRHWMGVVCDCKTPPIGQCSHRLW